MKKFVLMLILCAVPFTALRAEYLYLKDGQVIQGEIVSEDAAFYTVKTKYQVRKVARDDVLRIMYGERKMEPIYLIMNDGTTRKGFLVDQDSEKVIIREREDSAKEISIPKSEIRQMSAGEIVPLNPSIYLRGGYFIPLNSGGARLNSAPAIFAGSDMNFPFIRNTRVLIESGYINCDSPNQGMTMRFIPLLLSLKYHWQIGSSPFTIIPGITSGITLIDFNDGENSEYRVFAGTAGCSIGAGYEFIRNTLYSSVTADYLLFNDREATLHTLTVSASVSYRFK